MFRNIDLETELHTLRENHTDSQVAKTLDGFKKLFQADWECDLRIQDALHSDATTVSYVSGDSLDPKNVFELDAIRLLCVKYRLRFLPTRYFNPPFPPGAIRAIKKLEGKLGTEIRSFQILAPSTLFNLEDANKDPLLFCPLDDGRFYLIHKWGNDLAWHRKILAWPFRCFSNLCIFIGAFSIILAAIVPDTMVSYSPRFLSLGRFLFMVLTLLSTSAIVSYLWFLTNQRFSCDSWKSSTFN